MGTFIQLATKHYLTKLNIDDISLYKNLAMYFGLHDKLSFSQDILYS